MTRILVSGASIAGLTLAYWLGEQGFDTTVVERSPGLRPGGQAIDIRGAAVDVVHRMGLQQSITQRRLPTLGMTMLDAAGAELFRSDTMTLTGGHFADDEYEILRDDLLATLVERIDPAVAYRFGDTVTAIAETHDGLEVTLRSGQRLPFDVVVGADGIYSNIRRLGFGPDQDYLCPTALCVVNFTAPNTLGLDAWQVVCWEGDVRYIVYPVRDNRELRVFLRFAMPPGDAPRDPEVQRRIAADHCRALGWRMPELVDALMHSDDFYFGEVAQIKMDRWSTGRLTLTGDAAYCPSPMTGQGSSLAIVGAYVLATELGRGDGDYRSAFARYEQRMRPFALLNQNLLDELSGDEPDFAPISRVKNAIALDA